MSRPLRQNGDIGDDEPITLAEACRLFFGGRISPSALRTEAAKGNLVIEQIARKDFVTRQAIEDMRERCRKPASLPAYGFDQKPTSERARSQNHGASRTPAGLSEQDILRIRLRKRLDSSKTILPKSTSPSAEVVPLKS